MAPHVVRVRPLIRDRFTIGHEAVYTLNTLAWLVT